VFLVLPSSKSQPFLHDDHEVREYNAKNCLRALIPITLVSYDQQLKPNSSRNKPLSSYATLRKSWVAVVFRLLLVISLWQGPFPWMHRHTIEDPDLAPHLARFHDRDLTASDLGWHWHFSYPETGGNADSDGNEPVPQRISPSASLGCAQMLLTAEGMHRLFGFCLPISTIVGLIPVVRSANAHSDLARFSDATISLQLHCRMNC